jgi:hypothetical protein
VGFSDRLRAWLKGESKRHAASPSTSAASREANSELERFARSRIGVEAYLEPKTTIYSTTVLLVADDGEYLRRPVKDRGQAAALCGDLNIPLYDARKVGYPKRMRDYDQGRAPRRVELSDLPPWPGDEATGADLDGPPPPPPPPPTDPKDSGKDGGDEDGGDEDGGDEDRGQDTGTDDTGTDDGDRDT